MNAWKIVLATMIIFGTGVVTGGLLVRHAHRVPRNPQAQWSRSMPAPSPGGVRLDFLRRAERELDLDPVQRQRIDRLLKASQERTRKLMEPVSPQLRAELEKTRNEFRQVLTPAQRERFNQMVRQQQRAPRDPRHPNTPRERPSQPEATPPVH